MCRWREGGAGKMKGEWHAQCQMCTFPGHGCQILFKLHTCHQGDRRRGGRGECWEDSDYMDSRQIQTSWAHTRQHFCVWCMSPQWDQSETPERAWCHRAEVCRDRIPQWHFKCDATVRDKSHQRARRPWTTATRGCIFHIGVIIFRGQTSIIAQHTNNKTEQAFWRHKNLNKGHLKFTVKFTLSSDPP